ncbi:transposase, partial [Crocinitomix catalasitica]
VEPVFGTLTQFMGLRKVNTIGIKQANKVMHLAAMAYNLKKYLKFTQKLAKSEAKALANFFLEIKGLLNAKSLDIIPLILN